MPRALLALAGCALIAAGCSTFGEERAAPDTGGSEAGAADAAPDVTTVSPPDGGAVDGASPSCTELTPWVLDFEAAALPAEYVLPANNNVPTGIDGGQLTADLVIPDSGGQFRGRLQRDLLVPSGVQRVKLAFKLGAGATPPQTSLELGCSLSLRPDPQNPALDRRSVLRGGPLDLSFQWNGIAPSVVAALGAPASRKVTLTLEAAPDGSRFVGSLDVDGKVMPADLDLGAMARGLRLECGLVFGTALAYGIDVRTYSVSVDDVSLAVCARP